MHSSSRTTLTTTHYYFSSLFNSFQRCNGFKSSSFILPLHGVGWRWTPPRFLQVSSSFSSTRIEAPVTTLVNQTLLPPVQPMEYPFFIHRTKLARQLPVYVNKKCQHKVTSIQRIEGDIENLAKRLKEVLPEKCEITVKPQRRRIEVKWDHSQVIRDYLTQLGF